MSDSPAMEWAEFVSESESSESESRSLIKAVYWLAATSAITFLALLLGCVVVLIDDGLPGLSEFQAVYYWRVEYWCGDELIFERLDLAFGGVQSVITGCDEISTGSDTDSGRQWVVSRGGSGIKNDKFVVVVACVVHLGVVVIRVASRIAI